MFSCVPKSAKSKSDVFWPLMSVSRYLRVSALVVAGLLGYCAYAAQASADLPRYTPVRGITGNLSSVGSDTLANLMILWSDEFKRFYPNVNVQIQASGSSTAPPALTERTANVGPVSRELKDNEIEAFETRYGYKPTAVPVAIDALAVFVHKDNPIAGLSMNAVDAIFSLNQRCSNTPSFVEWGQLGLPGSWGRRNIQLFGRNSVSGTYGYFKEEVLCSGDFKNNVNEQPGSASVVQSVGTSINAIGYSGMGNRTSSVRAVPLAAGASDEFVAATAENVVAGRYPLARFLYIYINKEPNRELPPLEREFLKLILSEAGQQVVLRDGYVPLPANIVELARRSLGLDS